MISGKSMGQWIVFTILYGKPVYITSVNSPSIIGYGAEKGRFRASVLKVNGYQLENVFSMSIMSTYSSFF